LKTDHLGEGHELEELAVLSGKPPHPIEEYDLAIESGTVTLEQIQHANFQRLHGEIPDAYATYSYYYPRLLKRFHDQNGGLLHFYFARNTGCAAVLTQKKELQVKLSNEFFDDIEFIGILSKLTLLHLQARQFLNEDDFRICMDPVFNVIVYCLQSIDGMSYQSDSESDTSKLTVRTNSQQKFVKNLLRDEYSRAESDFVKVVQRNALVRYFYGMVVGVAALLIVGFITSSFIEKDIFGLPPVTMATVIAAGGIGAFISVLTRISSGRFTLNRGTLALQQAKKKAMMLWVLGAFRPKVGAVLAAAIIAFLVTGLLPVRAAADVNSQTYYAAIAFVAGFSERWAQDMILSTRATIFEERPRFLESAPTEMSD
jgi:hypothetical protein